MHHLRKLGGSWRLGHPRFQTSLVTSFAYLPSSSDILQDLVLSPDLGGDSGDQNPIFSLSCFKPSPPSPGDLMPADGGGLSPSQLSLPLEVGTVTSQLLEKPRRLLSQQPALS